MNIEKFDLVILPKGSKLTLLESYMFRKMENYVPQERKQTSKEKFINFSKNKYLASLFLLRAGGYNLKELAKRAKVSHGLLRKWRTEKEFNKLVNNHHREFVQLFDNYLESRREKQLKIFDEFLIKKTIEEIGEEECPQLGIDEYQDMAQYSDTLKISLFKVLMEKHKKFIKLIERDNSIKKKLRGHYLGVKEYLSNGETIDGLLKEMSEVSDELRTFIALKKELFLVTDILESAIKLPRNKRKYELISSMNDPRDRSSKVVKFQYIKDSKSWLLLVKHLLIHDSIDLKEKEGRLIRKQKPLSEKNRKLAVYLISQATSSMN